MCKRGNMVEMELPIAGDFRQGIAKVDKCIAPIIKALNAGGVLTKGCCCGHGEIMGYIRLANGKYLGVFPNRKTFMKHRHERFDRRSDK